MLIGEPESDMLDQVIYRGEGNSSIVIALKDKAKVIRLLKKDGKIMKSSQDHHATHHPMRSIKFIHLIMKPLAEPFLNFATELVHLKSNFINDLSRKVESERPIHRLDKTLHLDDQYALVMDDLCTLPIQLTRQLRNDDLCGPTISVEIKPKQGFLPINRLSIKSPNRDLTNCHLRDTCLYGMTQHLKLARGRIKQTSGYCPLNLFSGCPVRMKNALEELFLNPQNNLRIFENLTLAFDENNVMRLPQIFDDFFQDEKAMQNCKDAQKRDRFIDLLIQSLLRECNNNDEFVNPSFNDDDENSYTASDTCSKHSKARCRRCDTLPSSKKHKTDIVTNHKLPKYCVLSSVLRAQKLDNIGVQEANDMLEWLLEDSSTGNKNVDILEELSKPILPSGFGSPYQLPQESKQQYYFRKVWEFLVSLTAKDCSIIITIRRVNPDCRERIIRKKCDIHNYMLREQGTERYHLINVGIADLDQKMPSKIPRLWEHLNQIIVQTRGQDANDPCYVHVKA